jgi:hypothetical protein
MKNVQETEMAKTSEHQGFTLNNRVKRLQSTMHTLQKILASVQTGDQVKSLKVDKGDVTKKTCSITENTIYYSSRTNHSSRGSQCNKHNNNNNKILIRH